MRARLPDSALFGLFPTPLPQIFMLCVAPPQNRPKKPHRRRTRRRESPRLLPRLIPTESPTWNRPLLLACTGPQRCRASSLPLCKKCIAWATTARTASRSRLAQARSAPSRRFAGDLFLCLLFFFFFQVFCKAMDRDKAFQDTPRPTWKVTQAHWANLMKARSVGAACGEFFVFVFFLCVFFLCVLFFWSVFLGRWKGFLNKQSKTTGNRHVRTRPQWLAPPLARRVQRRVPPARAK